VAAQCQENTTPRSALVERGVLRGRQWFGALSDADEGLFFERQGGF